jgi:hypothetical protein
MLSAKRLRRCSKDPPPENSVLWVWHVHHIKCDVFGVRVFGSAEGHRECDSPNWFNSFPVEALKRLRWFSDLVSVKTHFVEGC